MKVERSKASSKERFQKKKFSRGASSSSGKRARESPAELVYSSATSVTHQKYPRISIIILLYILGIN